MTGFPLLMPAAGIIVALLGAAVLLHARRNRKPAWPGVLGILLGVGIGSTITYYTQMPTIYSAWSIILALAISSITGVIFGTYPAYKAAQQNPITVLRAE